MNHAFISYSSKQKETALALYELFKKNNINAWMAPYDIPVGSSYIETIWKAIEECGCFILLLSETSQQSEWVLRELLTSIDEKKVIIPLKIDDSTLTKTFKLSLGDAQILPVYSINEEDPNIKIVFEIVKTLLRKNEPKTAMKKLLDAANPEFFLDLITNYSKELLYFDVSSPMVISIDGNDLLYLASGDLIDLIAEKHSIDEESISFFPKHIHKGMAKEAAIVLTSGTSITMNFIINCFNALKKEYSEDCNIIYGIRFDADMGECIKVNAIVAGTKDDTKVKEILSDDEDELVKNKLNTDIKDKHNEVKTSTELLSVKFTDEVLASKKNTLLNVALMFFNNNKISLNSIIKATNCGFNRADAIMRELEKLGIVSAYSGEGRKLLVADSEKIRRIIEEEYK